MGMNLLKFASVFQKGKLKSLDIPVELSFVLSLFFSSVRFSCPVSVVLALTVKTDWRPGARLWNSFFHRWVRLCERVWNHSVRLLITWATVSREKLTALYARVGLMGTWVLDWGFLEVVTSFFNGRFSCVLGPKKHIQDGWCRVARNSTISVCLYFLVGQTLAHSSWGCSLFVDDLGLEDDFAVVIKSRDLTWGRILFCAWLRTQLLFLLVRW